jgi:hypothetical protein
MSPCGNNDSLPPEFRRLSKEVLVDSIDSRGDPRCDVFRCVRSLFSVLHYNNPPLIRCQLKVKEGYMSTGYSAIATERGILLPRFFSFIRDVSSV